MRALTIAGAASSGLCNQGSPCDILAAQKADQWIEKAAKATKEEAGRRTFVRRLQSLGPSDVLPIRSLPDTVLSNWKDAVTSRVVVTGERRAHYLERHPEIRQSEGMLSEVILQPDEVHRNKRDFRIAIFYKRLSADRYLRVALWVSNHDGLQNSVHSFREARLRETLDGQKKGRVVWTKA